jgi:hypothetical protein
MPVEESDIVADGRVEYGGSAASHDVIVLADGSFAARDELGSDAL